MVLDLLTVTLSPNDNIQPTKYTTDHLHQQKKAHKKQKEKFSTTMQCLQFMQINSKNQ